MTRSLSILASVVVLTSGCAGSERPPALPIAKTTPAAAPHCDEDSLEHFTPMIGVIRSMRTSEEQMNANLTKLRDSYPCGDLSLDRCVDAASSYAQERAFDLGLASRITRGKNDSGRRVVFRIGQSKTATRDFQSGSELVAFVRRAEREHQDIAIVDERPFVEEAPRIDIEYYDPIPMPEVVPSATLVYQVPPGRRAKWEALRSFEDDLAHAGLELDSASEKKLHERLISSLGPYGASQDPAVIALGGSIMAHEIPALGSGDPIEAPLELELSVRCRR